MFDCRLAGIVWPREGQTIAALDSHRRVSPGSWLHIVYKVWKYLRLYMKTFRYKTVDRWKLWLMTERLNAPTIESAQ